MNDSNWTFINKRYYRWTLVFKFTVTAVLLIFELITLFRMLMIGISRNFSKSYDITIPLIILTSFIFIFSVYYWVWKMRYNILNPSFRMNKDLIEIDRKQKIRFYWKELEQVIITDKVEFIGMLYNIERDAIIFKFPNEKEEYLIVGKGIYIHEFDKFISMLKSYVPKEKIIYKNEKPLSEVISLSSI